MELPSLALLCVAEEDRRQNRSRRKRTGKRGPPLRVHHLVSLPHLLDRMPLENWYHLKSHIWVRVNGGTLKIEAKLTRQPSPGISDQLLDR